MTAEVKRRPLWADRNLADVKNASTSRTNLGLAIGTDVQAYRADYCRIKTGTYTGDGTTSKAVTGVGFQPKYLQIVTANADGATTTCIWTTDTLVDNDAQGLAMLVAGAAATPRSLEDNRILSLDADGFTVSDDGTDAMPNTDGQSFEYLALG